MAKKIKSEIKITPESIIWVLSFIVTYFINILLDIFFEITPPLIKFILYGAMVYFGYRFLMLWENQKMKRFILPITRIRLTATYNQKNIKKIIKFITNTLITLDYSDITIRELRRSEGDSWEILASKLDEPKEKPKWKRKIKTNIRPMITLKKGKLKLNFLKHTGNFVIEESSLLYKQLKKCSHIDIKGKLIK